MFRLRFSALRITSVGLMLSIGGCMTHKEPDLTMRMSQVTAEMNDREAAAAYKSEAAILNKNAQVHRTMAQHYKARVGGKMDFSSIVRRCEKLAQQYEDAAKEAEAVSAALSQ